MESRSSVAVAPSQTFKDGFHNEITTSSIINAAESGTHDNNWTNLV